MNHKHQKTLKHIAHINKPISTTFHSLFKTHSPNNTLNSSNNITNNKLDIYNSSSSYQSCNSLQIKTTIQLTLLKSYEQWIQILLSFIGDKPSNRDIYIDNGTPIQRGLECIDKLQTETKTIKERVLFQKERNIMLRSILEEKQTRLKEMDIESNLNDISPITNEITILKKNLQMIANELDEQSGKYKYLHNVIMNTHKEEYMKYYNVNKEIKELKQMNKRYKEIINLNKLKIQSNIDNSINNEYNGKKNNENSISYNDCSKNFLFMTYGN